MAAVLAGRSLTDLLAAVPASARPGTQALAFHVMRWLGGARWRALHRAVYAVAVLAVLHFWWMRAGKNNFTEVWVYATVLAALLSARAWRFYAKNTASA